MNKTELKNIALAKRKKQLKQKHKSKAQLVLEYMQQGHTISSLEAFNMFRATRLSAIIFELRKHWCIENVWQYYGNIGGNYVEYKLIKKIDG